MRSEDLDWIDRDTRSLYGHYSGDHLANDANETIGDAMIEENEKERALELYRQTTEKELKFEYDRKVMELTKDYQRKLKDMDLKYSEKQDELDHKRSEIERSIESYPDEAYEPLPHEAFESLPLPHQSLKRTTVPRVAHMPTVELDVHPEQRSYERYG